MNCVRWWPSRKPRFSVHVVNCWYRGAGPDEDEDEEGDDDEVADEEEDDDEDPEAEAEAAGVPMAAGADPLRTNGGLLECTSAPRESLLPPLPPWPPPTVAAARAAWSAILASKAAYNFRSRSCVPA